jgi:capsular exopolysaccharide synthesis family protein
MNSHQTSGAPQREMEDTFAGSDSDLKLVAEYLSILGRGWKILLAFAVLGLGLGTARYLSAPVLFEATSQIQIERRAPNLLGGPVYSQGWWNPEFFPTQEQLLKGRGLAETVTRKLALWNDAYFDATVTRSSYVREGQAVTADDDQVVVARLASRVRGGLRVQQVNGTQLFNLTYTASDPRIAMTLANGYAESFIESGKASSRADAAQASSDIQTEIITLEREIQALEEQLAAYSQNSDIVAPNGETNVTLQRLTAANTAFLEAQRRRIEAQAEYNELTNRPPEDLAETLSGGLVSGQRAELIKLQREYETKLETYRADFPTMVDLKSQITEAQRQLDKLIEENSQQAVRTARARYQQALQTERSLESEYEAMKDETRRYQSASTALQNLTGDIDAKRETLDRLRRSQSQANIGATSGTQSVVTQTEKAILPTSPVSPSLRRHLPSGLILGLLCGIAIVVLADFMDRSIKAPEELEKRLGLPVLGVIPDVNRRSAGGRVYGQKKRGSQVERSEELNIDLLPQKQPRLPTSEAYRALRTATLLSRADEPQILVVSSTEAQEGKTATAMNLAVVLAQLGRKTLLIDADLRKPRIHESLGISNRLGLVNCLVHQADLDSVVQSTEVDNLWALPSGPLPPNPSELLSSSHAAELLVEARKQFDTIIIDTPPLLAVTDAVTVAVRSDGLLLCVRAGRASRESIQRCSQQLHRAGVPVLGTVFNAYRARSGRYGGRYGTYGGMYGVYGHQEPELKDDVA